MDNAQLSSIDQGKRTNGVAFQVHGRHSNPRRNVYVLDQQKKEKKKMIKTIFISQVVGPSIQNDNGWNEVGVQAQFVSKANKIWVNTTVT